MTTLREAAQQAMDILDSEFTTVNGEFCRWCDGRLSAKHNCKLEQVITALRAALAEPAQEPVAVLLEYENGERELRFKNNGWDAKETPLYTTPTPRKPVELTDEELRSMWAAYAPLFGGAIDFARAVIAAYQKKQGEHYD